MARDYQYYFSQLRRIEDHREAGSEKEIRKLYKQILNETRHFISDEYAKYAEDGKLTFDILRSKGQDARFLQEVEMRLGDLSLDVSRQIRRTTEEMYQLSYDGLREAVQKSKDAEELKELLQIPDMNTAQTMWATVDNTIMDVALEKNHKNIIWDIKREVATALTVGDRFDTMAQRLSKTLNGNYKKAILISRTEVGRVREAGHLASAKNLNETLKKGSTGLRMVKKWKSMKDGRVRDNHRSMHDKIVEMDEDFELPDGVKTQAPKQSGYARHDCNCRCTALYPMMDDEKFFKETGRHFSDKTTVKNSEVTDQNIAQAGKVEANGMFVNKSEKLYEYAKKVKPIDGFEDFTCHADPENFYIDLKGLGREEDYFQLSPEQYAEALKSSATYKGGNIRILSCQAGAKPDGAAQRLANAMNVDILAPTEIVNIDENGEMFISDSEIIAGLWYDASDRSKIKETGKWVRFRPKKR